MHDSSSPLPARKRWRRLAAGLAATAVAGGAVLPAYAAGAPGDDFIHPTFIGGARGGISLNNTGSTAEPGEPSHGKGSGGQPDKPDHSLWFDWVAPSTGRVVFRTKNSSIDTIMAAYEGQALATLTQLASNDDTTFKHPFSQTQSQIGFKAKKGTKYHIAVDSFTGSRPPSAVEQGKIKLSWNANDDFAAPIDLPTSSTATLLTFAETDGATRETGEPVHVPERLTPAGSLWHTWKAPKSGKVKFDVNASEFDAAAAAYSGTSFADLKQLGTARKGNVLNQGALTFTATAGTTYRIAMAGAGQGEEGEVVLRYGYV